MKKRLTTLAAMLACLALACGDDDKDEGGSCGADIDPDALQVTAVTKLATSDDECPTLTPAELNEPDEDDEDDGCEPQLDADSCSLNIDCTDEDGIRTSGTFDIEGDEVKGVLTVGAGGLTCMYDLVWK